MTAAILALVIASVALNATAQVAMRKTMLAAGGPPAGTSALLAYAVAIGLDPWFLTGMACYVVSLVLWMLVLSKLEVSLAFPLGAFAYVLTAAAGHLFLNEHVGALRLSGIALIIAGIVVVARS